LVGCDVLGWGGSGDESTVRTGNSTEAGDAEDCSSRWNGC
jgi:hypothetical protein